MDLGRAALGSRGHQVGRATVVDALAARVPDLREPAEQVELLDALRAVREALRLADAVGSLQSCVHTPSSLADAHAGARADAAAVGAALRERGQHLVERHLDLGDHFRYLIADALDRREQRQTTRARRASRRSR